MHIIINCKCVALQCVASEESLWGKRKSDVDVASKWMREQIQNTTCVAEVKNENNDKRKRAHGGD